MVEPTVAPLNIKRNATSHGAEGDDSDDLSLIFSKDSEEEEA